MIHSPAVSEVLLRQAATAIAMPQHVLAIELPGGTVRYSVIALEVTADPGAWYVEAATADPLPPGTYAAVLEQGAQRTPGAYTVVPTVEAGADAPRQGLQGIFRPA
jgi:hypothetical protein